MLIAIDEIIKKRALVAATRRPLPAVEAAPAPAPAPASAPAPAPASAPAAAPVPASTETSVPRPSPATDPEVRWDRIEVIKTALASGCYDVEGRLEELLGKFSAKLQDGDSD